MPVSYTHLDVYKRQTSHFVAASDNSTPVMPPASETSRLSTNCSRIRVIFRAPSALRRAISFCRAAERATIRLATLRHPISSMHVTAHSRMINGFFTSCARSWMRVRDATSSATGAFRFCKCSEYCTASKMCIRDRRRTCRTRLPCGRARPVLAAGAGRRSYCHLQGRLGSRPSSIRSL